MLSNTEKYMLSNIDIYIKDTCMYSSTHYFAVNTHVNSTQVRQ